MRAVIQSQVEPVPFCTCFHPILMSTDFKLNISSPFMDQLIMLIGSVIEAVKEHTEHWTEINEHKVCVFDSGSVCVHMQGSIVLILI